MQVITLEHCFVVLKEMMFAEDRCVKGLCVGDDSTKVFMYFRVYVFFHVGMYASLPCVRSKLRT